MAVVSVFALFFGVFLPNGFSFPMMALTIVGIAAVLGALWVLGTWAASRARERAAMKDAAEERAKEPH